MTKKDFELIAAILKAAAMPSGALHGLPTVHKELAGHFASVLAGTNPRFDSARFVAACTAAR